MIRSLPADWCPGNRFDSSEDEEGGTGFKLYR